MNKTINISLVLLLVAIGLSACRHKATTQRPLAAPVFNGDSAYAYIAGQVAFGPRVPGTDAHHDCVQYLGRTLERLGAKVEVQTGEVMRYDGMWQHVANIVAYLPADSAYSSRPAVLLTAHYDSRPWADQEEDYSNRMVPIDGANDGASGVGVLLELARQWQLLPERRRPVTIVLFDCEDMGTPAFYTGQQHEHSWCLGAQLWARTYQQKTHLQPIPQAHFTSVGRGDSVRAGSNHSLPYEGRVGEGPYSFGILLDMVGDPNATFPREYYSEQYAGKYVDKIWRTAEQLGYAHRFVNSKAYPITDDHYYVNTIAKIPCVDIIHYTTTSETGFPWWWHTHNDNINNISPNTLREVGQVIMAVINE